MFKNAVEYKFGRTLAGNRCLFSVDTRGNHIPVLVIPKHVSRNVDNILRKGLIAMSKEKYNHARKG